MIRPHGVNGAVGIDLDSSPYCKYMCAAARAKVISCRRVRNDELRTELIAS